MTDTTPAPEGVTAALDDHDPISWFDEKDGFSHGTKVPAKWVLIAYSELVRQRATLETLAADLARQTARADALADRLGKETADHDATDRRCKRLVARIQAAEAKVAKLVEALTKIGTLAPVEKPPEPYDEYGWQIADTSDRHASMVAAKDMWTVADFARTTIAEVQG